MQNLRRIATGLAIGAVLVTAFVSRGRWWPAIEQRISSTSKGDEKPSEKESAQDGQDEHEGHDHGDHPEEVVVSRQAQSSLGLRVAKLRPSDYPRELPMPGRVVVVPGVSHRDVPASLSGVVTRIHVGQGQLVMPNDPLFEVRLVHSDAVRTQLELLDALAKLEVTKAERNRLAKLNSTSPGVIASSRILKQDYEISHIRHTVSMRRQALLMLGLSAVRIDAMIKRHQSLAETPRKTPMAGEHDADHFGEHPLVESVTIRAPKTEAESAAEAGFVVETLDVHLGEHVDAGRRMCRLADYGSLLVEGQVYERDLPAIRQVISKDWVITVSIEQRDGQQLHTGLRILYLAAAIDDESRAGTFYVELPNRRVNRRVGNRVYSEWEFKPGQRVEIRVPIEQFKNQLVVPPEAVARHGLEHYMFQAKGDHFVRRAVTVKHRDTQRVVIADDGSLHVGGEFAMSAAAQLQLAILNQSAGPVGHGHSH
jgi:multidrug efflux pump subunit AcrA (membrane-fusion protein)